MMLMLVTDLDNDCHSMKPSFATAPLDKKWPLTLALLLALGLHAVVILGLRLPILTMPSPEPAQTLQVTLLGQADGEPEALALEEPRPSAPAEPSPRTAESPSDVAEPPVAIESAPMTTERPLEEVTEPPVVGERRPAMIEPPPAVTEPPVAAEPSPSITKLAPVEPEPTQSVKPPTPPKASTPPALSAAALMSRGLQMARLEAAPRPLAERAREKHLNLKALSTVESFYFEAWRRKVEQVGELNFPEEAKRRQAMLGPTLDVALRADGSLHSIALVRSSGNQALDAAARRIVELAAPFAPFPEELRRQYDILHIVRTWEFKQSGQLVGK